MKLKILLKIPIIQIQYLAPRANVLFDVFKGSQLRVSYARGFRAPQIFDEDLHIEASTARRITHELADDLTEEKSNSYTVILGLHQSLW